MTARTNPKRRACQNKVALVASLFVAVGGLGPTAAGAASAWPLQPAERPLLLPPLSIEAGIKPLRVGNELAVVPSLRLGVTERFLVEVGGERGVLLRSSVAPHPRVEDVRVGVHYLWVQTDALEVATSAAWHNKHLGEPSASGYAISLTERWRTRGWSLQLTASYYFPFQDELIAQTGSDDDLPYNARKLDLQLRAELAVGAAVATIIRTGFSSISQHGGDPTFVPLAIGVLWALSAQVDVGGELALPYLFGQANEPNALEHTPTRVGIDHRELLLIACLRY